MKKQRKSDTESNTLFDLGAYHREPEPKHHYYNHPDSVDWEGDECPAAPEKLDLGVSDRVCLRATNDSVSAIDTDTESPSDVTDELCPHCKHFDKRTRFCWEWAIKFDEGDTTMNECPSFDSVSPIEAPQSDTESSLSLLQSKSNDSVSPLISGADDSVSPIEAFQSDTESSLSQTDTHDSVSIIDADTESPYHWDRQGDLKYVPGGTARTKNNYFRYSYRDNGKMRHVHIPGGNTGSPAAQMHWEEVQRLVRSGASPKYIVQIIKSWSLTK